MRRDMKIWERYWDLCGDPWTTSDEERDEERDYFIEHLKSGDVQDAIDYAVETRDAVCKPYDGVHGVFDFEKMKEYDDLIEDIKSFRPVTVYKDIDPHLTTVGDGSHIFVSDRGIKYDLLEGVSMGANTTSDIFFVMFTLYDCDDQDMVGWSYGATFYKDIEYIDWMIKVTDEWENAHQVIVDRILKGEIKEL